MSFKSSSCRGATKLSFLGSAQKVNELSGTALKTPNTTRLLAFLCKSGSQNGSLIGSEKSTRTPVWIFTKDFTGAVHILRQPPEGGEGVWQMLTIADEGGRGGKPKADHC